MNGSALSVNGPGALREYDRPGACRAPNHEGRSAAPLTSPDVWAIRFYRSCHKYVRLGRKYSARAQLQNKAPGLRYGTWNFDKTVNLDPNNPGVVRNTAGCRDYMFGKQYCRKHGKVQLDSGGKFPALQRLIRNVILTYTIAWPYAVSPIVRRPWRGDGLKRQRKQRPLAKRYVR